MSLILYQTICNAMAIRSFLPVYSAVHYTEYIVILSSL